MCWNEDRRMSIVWPIWKQPLSSQWNSINFTMLTYFNGGKAIFILCEIFCVSNGFWRHLHLYTSRCGQVFVYESMSMINDSFSMWKIFLNTKFAYRFSVSRASVNMLFIVFCYLFDFSLQILSIKVFASSVTAFASANRDEYFGMSQQGIAVGECGTRCRHIENLSNSLSQRRNFAPRYGQFSCPSTW